MITFKNDREFQRMLDEAPSVIHEGAVNGVHEALDDWLKRARPIAPKDIGFLRAEMKTQLDTALMEGTLLSNAYSQGFNYAYFLNEVGSQKGYKPRTPGTSLTWLKDTMDEKRSFTIIENSIQEELKKRGW